ncbi:MAG: zinc finger Ran-binding domain-containing protein [Acidobacteria bacterium]|nr:zinc finger Ran-binding domain-containing protein [Acidobacteriota bacterium]
MSSRKCPRCGMVNWADAGACKRCGAALAGGASPERERSSERAGGSGEEVEDSPKGGGLLRRAAVVFALVAVFMVAAYASLILTSEPASAEQRQLVERAIAVLEAKGLGDRTFALRHLASYRVTDNWWNRWIGHHEAYAATNFPFEVVTLYPDFFTQPTDDTERAVVLLHESYHLGGSGEEAAFTGVWRDKRRLGWTKEAYGHTRVWQNVREFTAQNAPALFRCGDDGKQDCLE